MSANDRLGIHVWRNLAGLSHAGACNSSYGDYIYNDVDGIDYLGKSRQSMVIHGGTQRQKKKRSTEHWTGEIVKHEER